MGPNMLSGVVQHTGRMPIPPAFVLSGCTTAMPGVEQGQFVNPCHYGEPPGRRDRKPGAERIVTASRLRVISRIHLTADFGG